MPLPTSGPISLRDIQDEFGGSQPLVITNYYKGGAYVLLTDYAPNVPTSGTISLRDFYGARKTTQTVLTFTDAGDNFFVLPSTFTGNLTIQSMTGGGGGGGGSDDQPGHVGYAGFTVTGGNISASPNSLVNAYVGAGGGPGGSGGGSGGGGGGSIICQKLAELGYFDREMNAADQRFGKQLLTSDQTAYLGYIRWAKTVVDLLEGGGSAKFRQVVLFWIQDEQQRQQFQIKLVAGYLDALARPWAEEMAHRMGAAGYEQSNFAGRLIMDIGLPMCRAIGKSDAKTQWPVAARTVAIWGTATVLLVTVTVISATNALLNKIRRILS